MEILNHIPPWAKVLRDSMGPDYADVRRNNPSPGGKRSQLTIEMVEGQDKPLESVELAKLRGYVACEWEKGTRSKATAI